jgi:site-specific recombinase XerD
MKKERSKFRNFFRYIIDEIIENEDKIKKLFKTKKNKTRKRRGVSDDV